MSKVFIYDQKNITINFLRGTIKGRTVQRRLISLLPLALFPTYLYAHNNGTVSCVQLFMFGFGLLLFSLLCFTIVKKHTGWATFNVSSLFIIVVVVSAVDPLTIKNLYLSKGEFSIERYKPTKEDVVAVLKAADDYVNANTEKVIEIVSQAEGRQKNERSDTDYLVLATTAWREKKYTDALIFVKEGLNLPSTNIRVKATLHHRLGTIYHDLGNQELAMNSYQIAVKLDPTFAWPVNSLGVIYDDKEQYDIAMSVYTEAIDLDPNYIAPYINLALTYAKTGQHKDAIVIYQKVIELDPNNSELYFNLGSTYGLIGKNDEAITAYRKSIELNPNEAKEYNNLGDIYFRLGRYEDAVSVFKRAIELGPKDSLPHYNLYYTYKRLNQFDNALAAYRQASEFSKNNLTTGKKPWAIE